ncbi:hypothetical protein C8R44DRAFT_742905 [Mycena epipterygia]|nr:hypothetical protein C8R44DRAFT_742905 [Mycena epipterygia]
MGLSWCNLVLTTVSNNQIYGGSSTILAALLLSFIYYLPAAIEINQLGASENTLSGTLRVLMASISCHTKISSRGRREYLWYWSGPTQNGVSIPPRGWRGRLAPPTPNTSSGTPRVLITSISPHTKRCYHPPSRLNGSSGDSDPEHVVGDAESADHINQPPHKTPTQTGIIIPSRGGTGRLVAPTPNTSSGTPRALITSISPHIKWCSHPLSRLEGSSGTSELERVVGDPESAYVINRPKTVLASHRGDRWVVSGFRPGTGRQER